jgi:hypothetical protein
MHDNGRKIMVTLGILCRGINGTYSLEFSALMPWNGGIYAVELMALICGIIGTYTAEWWNLTVESVALIVWNTQ